MNFRNKVRNIHLFNHSVKHPNKFVPEYAKWFQDVDCNIDNEFWMYGDGKKLDGLRYKRFKQGLFMGLSLFFSPKADKYIFHSLPSKYLLVFILCLIYLKRTPCYMIIWGGEIHFKENNKRLKDRFGDFLSKKLLSRMAGFITYIESDYKAACHYSGNYKAEWVKIQSCYPSNVLAQYEYRRALTPKVLIGSSALKRNNHKLIIDILASQNMEGFEYYLPLSYGEPTYGKEIAGYAIKKLDRATAVFDFMSYMDYVKFLSSFDFAIFANKGQQGMGNIINLLGFGCKVFLDEESDSYNYFVKEGFSVYSLSDLNEANLKPEVLFHNIKLAKKLFSKETLLEEMVAFLKQRNVLG